MKIAIIGAGFSGLAAGFELVKKGHQVYIFEKDPNPGGLAIGYKEKNWDWSLEKHYHHWFTNDKSILNLAKEINYEVIIKRPKTSVFIKNNIYQFDSPVSVLKFPLLSVFERIRMGFVIGALRYNPFWKILEKYNAAVVLPKLIGRKSYEMIWEPLFINKFGKYAGNVSLAWFWARITKRTPALAYPAKGFLEFAREVVKEIEKNKGNVFFESEILELKKDKSLTLTIKHKNGKVEKEDFDKVIVTTPSFLFLKIAPQLPQAYRNSLGKLKGIGATNLLLRLKKPFFKDNTYWLNVCDNKAPVMAIVEHTNFMDRKNYDNEHLLYLGNYREASDLYFAISKEEMLKLFDKYLRKINPDYFKNIIGYELFKAPFAQPIIPINYSKIIPSFITPLENVYLANIEQVYPWDRGTNYAVELGIKVANLIDNNE
ncbi:MAG: Amine oxidase [Candidatus Levybacteria bacterium GW2011_GWB1_35_5]|nr:MAG: Amine oxidase [Candidatus Levybacteria bacterium GW2011_GWB1_35_5]